MPTRSTVTDDDTDTDTETGTDTNDSTDANEAQLARAVAELRSETNPNLSETAKKYKVSYHTLRRRYLGKSKPKRASHAHLQLLTPTQEKVLCDWAIFLSLRGQPVEKETLAPKIFELSGTNPSTQGLSKSWWRGFFRRNPEIRLGRASGVPPSRAQGFNFDAVNDFFNIVDRVLKRWKIPWRLVLNMDEKGLQIGSRKVDRKKCIIPIKMPNTTKLQSDDLQLVTIIECVSAEGVALDPAFVFPGESHFDEWYNVEGFKDSKYM